MVVKVTVAVRAVIPVFASVTRATAVVLDVPNLGVTDNQDWSEAADQAVEEEKDVVIDAATDKGTTQVEIPTLRVGPGVGLGDGVGVGDGLGDGVGVGLGLGDGDGVGVGLGLGDGAGVTPGWYTVTVAEDATPDVVEKVNVPTLAAPVFAVAFIATNLWPDPDHADTDNHDGSEDTTDQDPDDVTCTFAPVAYFDGTSHCGRLSDNPDPACVPG